MRTVRKLRLFFLLGLIFLTGCFIRDIRLSPIRPPSGKEARVFRVITTGYCPCKECCGWKRNWLGRPVVASGPSKGQAKKVGITASGERAKPGTVAVDTGIFPFGTVFYVPGYGYGRGEDRGGAIKGYHVDLFFKSHREAQQWGHEIKDVKVWFPRSR